MAGLESRARDAAARAIDDAAQAYLDRGPEGATLVEDERTCTQAWVRADGDGAVVAFRGTESVVDCLYDARLTRRRPAWAPRGVRAHAGFLACYESVRDRLAERLAEMGPRRVLATGHSLGGALAQIFAADYGGADVDVVSFGAPRAGNAAFARLLAAQAARCVAFSCRRDLVCALPSRLLGRFADAPGQVHVRGDGALAARAPSYWLHSLGDHSLDEYRKALV